eukprot:1252677-Ditylum_brightwellii.AAC.1
MSLPRGWEQPGKVPRLKKFVYGLAQALFAWFKKLKQGLEDTDNCLMFERDIKDVDAAIQKMVGIRFQLQVEDHAAGFLGIELDRQDDGSIELKQTALI